VPLALADFSTIYGLLSDYYFAFAASDTHGRICS
jgi:hypothetical protein